jgi:phosphogluconate dehydratase
MAALHPVLLTVTKRIAARSAASRQAYLDALHTMRSRNKGSERLGCANVAHAFAAMPQSDKFKVVSQRAPNIAIVTAYNDMLSAHAPLQHYPDVIKQAASECGVTAQVAGGVPAMCDGITQGTAGMELSLFSRDTIAMATAIALSHDVFDAALLLGVCDKIVPGLLIGALHFGHLPTALVPAGPMPSGLSNAEKAQVREQAAKGRVERAALLQAEMAAYHAPGTCTFYGTANSNQLLMEVMGLHVPGAAFVPPDSPLRAQLTRAAVKTVLQAPPIGVLVDARSIVNALVALLATGGSTNHLIHWVAVARAAGMHINWDDFAHLSAVVPLLARIYPNGSADVNQFHAAGGTAFVIHTLLEAGLLHPDALTVDAQGVSAYTFRPELMPALDGAFTIHYQPVRESTDTAIVRSAAQPFSATGGLQVLEGNLGRSVIKVSAVPQDRYHIEAPCAVFDTQEAVLQAFNRGELQRDVVVVVRWQGPQANGMPELHKLTPALAVLQGQGFRVALVTDGRMSGASGKVPAAIHVTPEAAVGGPLSKLRSDDRIQLDAHAGTLNVLVDVSEWQARSPELMPQSVQAQNSRGMGRDLFAAMRRNVSSAEEGACSWL